MPQLMADAGVPGVTMAVIKDSQVLWRRGFGVRDRATRAPVTDDTAFEAASVSKTVFAYLALNLCEKGILGLDTPLSSYVPYRLLEGDSRLDRITTRHVLSHTSGLQNWRSGRDPLRIHFEPGNQYLYSGEGYFYLQSVITHLTGQRDPSQCARFEGDLEVCATNIAQYMATNLLEPFGMRSSSYRSDDALEQRAARPHDTEGNPIAQGQSTEIGAARYAAAGGLRTTATDYARFLLEVLNPRAPDRFRMTGQSVRDMLRPHVTVDASTSWALGWQIRHTPTGDLIQHQGGQAGFQAFTAASVGRQSGFVILTNSDNGARVFYSERFSAIIDRLLFS